METYRLIQLKYKIKKYNFNAIIDPNYSLHLYVELYNFNRPEWDAKIIFVTNEKLKLKDNIINQLNSKFRQTIIPLDFIIEETKKWIKENE